MAAMGKRMVFDAHCIFDEMQVWGFSYVLLVHIFVCILLRIIHHGDCMEFEEWLYAGGRGRGYMQGVGVLTIVIVLIYYYFCYWICSTKYIMFFWSQIYICLLEQISVGASAGKQHVSKRRWEEKRGGIKNLLLANSTTYFISEG
jgi:hypothetical protein